MSIRTAIFADVQNIYYTTREAYGKQFDYRKLWAQVSSDAKIEQAFAYATDRGEAGQRRFQAALRHIGFDVKLKPYIQRSDGSAKGDWDVGITIDVLEAAPQTDRVVLLSGDGDFDLLVQKIQSAYDVDVTVYGVPGLTARSLIEAAHSFIAIEDDLLL